MADDKDEGIPDPWAGLEGVGEGDAKDEFAFSFEGLEADAATDDVAEIGDEPAAMVEELVERVVEDSSPEFESLEAEPVVEDDIAGWLGEPAPKAENAQPLNDEELQAAALEELEADEGEAEEVVETLSFGEAAAAVGGIEFDAGDQDTDDANADDAVVAFAELDSGEVDLEPAAVLAIGGAAATTAPAVASKPKAKKKSGGGALGPILGGLLSLPVVFLILLGVLWGTGRDPIGMRSWLPSFMLPARQGGRAVAAANAKPSSLDDLAATEADTTTEEAAADEPGASDPETPSVPTPEISPEPVPLVGDPSSPAIEVPSLDDPLLAGSPDTPVVPVTEPVAVALDLSGIDTAVDVALASMNRVAESAAGAERRRALVAWYKDLARVGAELAMLETAAADSGRPLDEPPAAIATLYERLGSANDIVPDLKRLCRNWVDYAKRPADGVLLVGVLDAARKVGPFWYATLSLEQVDGTMRPLSLISRREPRADPGDRVAVAGVVFSEDTVWSADCGRLGATAAVEDDPF